MNESQKVLRSYQNDCLLAIDEPREEWDAYAEKIRKSFSKEKWRVFVREVWEKTLARERLLVEGC